MSLATNAAYRLTRSSYKRKIITFGVSIFASLSLIATGFASWVLSSGTQKEANSNVQVGVVQDGSITATEIAFENDIKTFSFNPLKDDLSGQVRWDKVKYDQNTAIINYESMKVTFMTTVTNIDSIKNLTVTMAIPDSVTKTAQFGYIRLPSCAGATVSVITDGVVQSGDNWTWQVDEEDETKATLTYTIEFKWGDRFGGHNPSYYYDEVAAGQAVEFEEVRETLHRFRASMFGYNEFDDGDPNTEEDTFEEYMALSAEQQEALSFAEDAFKVTVDIESK